MNEEYFTYHRNAFSRLMYALATVHQRLMESEVHSAIKNVTRSHKNLKVQDMAPSYNSDCQRKSQLIQMIERLNQKLSDNEREYSMSDQKVKSEIDSENMRIRMALRRRTCELRRLEASMHENYHQSVGFGRRLSVAAMI